MCCGELGGATDAPYSPRTWISTGVWLKTRETSSWTRFQERPSRPQPSFGMAKRWTPSAMMRSRMATREASSDFSDGLSLYLYLVTR